MSACNADRKAPFGSDITAVEGEVVDARSEKYPRLVDGHVGQTLKAISSGVGRISPINVV
jgi:hypothetical protein